jgi:hypothetical protein
LKKKQILSLISTDSFFMTEKKTCTRNRLFEGAVIVCTVVSVSLLNLRSLGKSIHRDAFLKSSTTENKIQYREGGPSNISLWDHPHAGARDADGYWNYVPDVTFVRRNVLEQLGNVDTIHYFPLEPDLFETVCQVIPGTGLEELAGYERLHYLQLNGSNPVPEHAVQMNHMNESDGKDPTTTDISNLSSPKILCAVYTHDERHDQIRAIVETWGWRCDGFFAASTKTVVDMGAIDLPHRGKEEYANMWQKTRSMLAFMFDNYIDEYDYFHVLGDDTYVIVENLRNYLSLLEALERGRDTRPLYIGQPIGWSTDIGDVVGNGGGPGYILNRFALRRFVLEALPTCLAEVRYFAEDQFVAMCMKEMDIPPIDTYDAGRRKRFHGFSPSNEMDPSSTQSVAFHQIKTPALMKRHHAIIYNSCPVGTVLRDAIDKDRNE